MARSLLLQVLMFAAIDMLRRLGADDRGQSVTEYAICVGTIAFAIILMLTNISDRLGLIFTNVQGHLNSVPTS